MMGRFKVMEEIGFVLISTEALFNALRIFHGFNLSKESGFVKC
jgi:hypothetical protein